DVGTAAEHRQSRALRRALYAGPHAGVFPAPYGANVVQLVHDYFFFPPTLPALPALRRMYSPRYRRPLPLYGSGGRSSLMRAATSPTRCLSTPVTMLLTSVRVSPHSARLRLESSLGCTVSVPLSRCTSISGARARPSWPLGPFTEIACPSNVTWTLPGTATGSFPIRDMATKPRTGLRRQGCACTLPCRSSSPWE